MNARPGIGAILILLAPALAAEARQESSSRDDGYRGIWYSNQPTKDTYRYKYSGGLGTYPQPILPLAIYSKEANKTFFCYGGSLKEKNELLMMASYYDHATGRVPRPTILLNKKTDDAHDNPCMAIDDRGHVWIFSNAHGTSRPAYIHRSLEPFSVEAFEQVLKTNFSYGQPWHLPGKGILFLHTRYRDRGRSSFWMTSPDGRSWSEPQILSRIELGHYQVSHRHGDKVGTAFNMHPKPVGLNARTNLYYVETPDFGRTWRAADGTAIAPPLSEVKNPALVHDYQAEGLLVYMKDVAHDAGGRPVILFLTSKGFEPGPENGPRLLHTARWTGRAWEIRPVAAADHNYDFGPLYLEEDGAWKLIAPTDPGPQPHMTGGEIVVWTSRDEGKTWKRAKTLTSGSPRNHTYVRRPVDAHPAFYAFWADGDSSKPSESHLYFTDRDCTAVWRLPPVMSGDFAAPEKVR